MSADSGDGGTGAAADNVFQREIRFAVVMYGGVSLAVYMNGIAQELLRMVRATAPAGGDPASGRFRFRVDDPALTSTERLYRKIAGNLRARFVVDIISGTSAGGINGVFLAKALAHNRPLDQLRRLWVQEGDVGRLLNDRGALAGNLPPDLADDPPASLLSGQRFYWQLLEALEEMDKGPAMAGLEDCKGAPYVDEIDLYVTATDFQGANLPLALFDKTIEEPVHKKLFRFRYFQPAEEKPEVDDFAADSNPLLAFAARCTASFPAAFAPFKLEDVDAALGNHPAYAGRMDRFGSDAPAWQRLFDRYPPDYAKRFFVDGGYLDNKPFDAAVRALESRHHVLLPVDRKLLYIEPDPERQGRNKEISRPDVVSALAAVASLPRVETIRAEIDEIERRNRIYDRASVLVAAVQEDAPHREEVVKRPRRYSEAADDWAMNDLQDLVGVHGLAYGGYHRLKVSSIVDWLATGLFGAVRPDSTVTADTMTADKVRAWVTAWREGKYKLYYAPAEREALQESERDEKGDPRRTAALEEAKKKLPLMETRLLIDLDVAYRLRRIEFVRIKLRELLQDRKAAEAVLTLAEGKPAATPAALSEADWRKAWPALVDFQRKLSSVHQKLLVLNDACLRLTVAPLPPAASPLDDARRDFASNPRADTAAALLNRLAETVGARLNQIGDECRQVIPRDPAGDTFFDRARRALGHLFAYFDDFDLVGFPLLYCLGTQELAKIEVFRVSAADTKLANEGAEKLAGIKLGHFGAFLDPGWRENDIFWGRLDGAERIIDALTKRHASDATVQAWQNESFESIVADRKAELAAAAAPAFAPAPAPVATPAVAAPRPRAEIVADVRRLTAAADLPPERTLRLLARSTAIVRRLVGGVAEERSLQKSIILAWALRFLLVVWGVVEMAVPRSLVQLLARHWLNLIMLSGVLLAIVGPLFGRSDELYVGLAVVVGAILLRALAQLMTAVASRHTPRARPAWLFVPLVAGAIAFAVGAPRATATIGPYKMLDFELAHDRDRLHEIFDKRADCLAHVRSAIRWDFLVVAGYGVGLFAASLLIRSLLLKVGSRRAAWVAKNMASAAIVAALADLAENAGMLRTLSWQSWLPPAATGPHVRPFLLSLVPGLTFAASATKWFLLACVGALNALALLVGLATAAVRRLRIRRRAGSLSAHDPGPQSPSTT